jgi:predicted RNase H-like nuclease (RuvC/YqgF family)
MSLENTELKVGNTSFKGVWIAIVLTIGTSIGGTVWTASSLYSRLETVEAVKIPNIKPVTERVTLIEQRLQDNDVGQLKAKLATLGTHLETILTQQEKLLEIKAELSELSKEIEAMKAVVKQGELIADSMGDVDTRMNKLTKEIEDLWQGMDYLNASPLQR